MTQAHKFHQDMLHKMTIHKLASKLESSLTIERFDSFGTRQISFCLKLDNEPFLVASVDLCELSGMTVVSTDLEISKAIADIGYCAIKRALSREKTENALKQINGKKAEPLIGSRLSENNNRQHDDDYCVQNNN